MRQGPPRAVSLTYVSADVRPVPDCAVISDLVAVRVAVGDVPLTGIEPESRRPMWTDLVVND